MYLLLQQKTNKKSAQVANSSHLMSRLLLGRQTLALLFAFGTCDLYLFQVLQHKKVELCMRNKLAADTAETGGSGGNVERVPK